MRILNITLLPDIAEPTLTAAFAAAPEKPLALGLQPGEVAGYILDDIEDAFELIDTTTPQPAIVTVADARSLVANLLNILLSSSGPGAARDSYSAQLAALRS